MRTFVGSLLFTAGILGGLWAGVWWAFIGGIVQFLDAWLLSDSLGVALGIARVWLSVVIGYLAGLTLCLPGWVLLTWRQK